MEDAGGAAPGTGGTGLSPTTSECPEGATRCDGSCVSLNTSLANCGACGASCGTAMTCEAGQCVCEGSLTSCDGVCVNLATDGNNCGSCGNVCAGQVCSAAVCNDNCSTGTPCGTSCADLSSDVQNCGTCGNACAAGQVCQAGACSCPSGQLSCDGACVDVSADSAHCGACNVACDTETTCVGGVCQAAGVGGTGTVGGGGGIGGTGGTPVVGAGGTPRSGTGGTPLSGTGGRPTGGAATGGRATGGAITSVYAIDDGGYVIACSWHGFAWTGAGPDSSSTIQPADFGNLAAGAQLCATGTVGADPDYSGYAMVGVNLGQENSSADDPPNPAIVPQGNGLYVSVSNHASNDLRIQIQDALGGDNEDHRWCALYDGPGMIPWNEFNTACWDGSGTPYNREPINAAIVAVPGHNTNDTPFDFCIEELRPAGDPACPN